VVVEEWAGAQGRAALDTTSTWAAYLHGIDSWYSGFLCFFVGFTGYSIALTALHDLGFLRWNSEFGHRKSGEDQPVLVARADGAELQREVAVVGAFLLGIFLLD